ncbi:MAG: hypothetical protein MHM6MM_000569 [Cercozoa sp. M6MM]
MQPRTRSKTTAPLRFQVRKVKSFGRKDTTRVLEVDLRLGVVRVAQQGTRLRVRHEFDLVEGVTNLADDLRVQLSSPGSRRTYEFARAEDKARFLRAHAMALDEQAQLDTSNVGGSVQGTGSAEVQQQGLMRLHLLEGERVLHTLSPVVARMQNIETYRERRGSVFVTNYRIAFSPRRVSESARQVTVVSALTAPLLLSLEVDVAPAVLSLLLKDGRRLRFDLRAVERPARASFCLAVRELTMPTDTTHVFAYQLGETAPAVDLPEELQGFETPAHVLREMYAHSMHVVAQSPQTLRLSLANKAFGLCDTYPELLVVPADINDEQLKAASEYRSRGRLPAVVWSSPWQSGVTISRCSQPLSGLRGSTNECDGLLVGALARTTGADSASFFICDARPRINAVGNQLKGKGVENMHVYDRYGARASLAFMDIANIHVMRRSLTALRKACEMRQEDTFWKAVHDSRWLHHVAGVLYGAQQIVNSVADAGVCVLVHCSDGWDRTSQLCTLAQVLLDARFRTRRGLIELLRKDWLWFGHKVADRCRNFGAHGAPSMPSSGAQENSPVLLQLLDALFQLTHLFPRSFEFSEDFLLAVAHHMYSGRFGDFFGNCVQDRVKLEVYTRTQSLWPHLLQDARYVNRYYDARNDDSDDNGVLRLGEHASAHAMRVWRDVYMRFDSHGIDRWQHMPLLQDTLSSPSGRIDDSTDEACHRSNSFNTDNSSSSSSSSSNDSVQRQMRQLMTQLDARDAATLLQSLLAQAQERQQQPQQQQQQHEVEPEAGVTSEHTPGSTPTASSDNGCHDESGTAKASTNDDAQEKQVEMFSLPLESEIQIDPAVIFDQPAPCV